MMYDADHIFINGESYRHLSDFVSFPSANSNFGISLRFTLTE